MPGSQTVNRRVCMKTIASGATGIALPMATAARRARAAETDRPLSPVIDTHMHVWSDDPRRFPFVHPYQPDFKEPPTPATVEMLLDDMDQNGVTHAILVQVIYHGWDNRYVVECVGRVSRATQAVSDVGSTLQGDPVVKPVRQAHRDRFRGHGLIDPTDPAAAEKLEYWVREQGLSGMRLSPIYYQGRDAWLNSQASHALWKKAEELGAVFNLFIASEQLPRLQQMVERFPAVPVLIDHLAYVRADAPPAELDKLLALARCPSVSVKVSELQSISPQKTYPFRDTYGVVERVYDAFGPDRLLWGTGFPGAARAHYNRPTLKQELDLIRTHIPFFTAEDKRKILGLNAARIWKIEA